MDDEDEQRARADLDAVRARIAELPNALSLAAALSEGAVDRSGLDLRSFHLVRAAALAASGAPPVAWEINLELMDPHVSADEINGMLAAIAPIIGTSKYLSAVASILGEA
jgi:alkylhydroperoxidase/carboxymuconolactone decarboxylase family protein YurZ